MRRALTLRRVAAAATATALLCWASTADVARAQSCGPPESSSSSSDSGGSDDSESSNSGGSSSDDSSGGSWGDSPDYGGSSSSSSSGESSTPACTDRTDVTGFEECTRFGRGWNAIRPALRFEIGPSFRRLSLGGIEVGGTTYHDGNPHRFFLAADDLDDPSTLTAGVNLRFTVPVFSNFLLGAELDLAGGNPPDGAVANGDLSLRIAGVQTIGGGLVAGVVIPVGPLRFRGEVLAGGEGLVVTTASLLGDCVSEDTDVITRFRLEPRVGIEFFVGRYVSFDVWGGVDVVNQGSYGGGLRINLHTRAYDAVR
ncbi:MAG: hypothetical protein JRH11_22525 [Deltaproteobacteria bacterium]|nr:hypothetical protein [Deltaproteobacteria bacterium]